VLKRYLRSISMETIHEFQFTCQQTQVSHVSNTWQVCQTNLTLFFGGIFHGNCWPREQDVSSLPNSLPNSLPKAYLTCVTHHPSIITNLKSLSSRSSWGPAKKSWARWNGRRRKIIIPDNTGLHQYDHLPRQNRTCMCRRHLVRRSAKWNRSEWAYLSAGKQDFWISQQAQVEIKREKACVEEALTNYFDGNNPWIPSHMQTNTS